MIDIKAIFLSAVLMASGMVEARSVATSQGVANTVTKLGFKAVSPALVTEEEKRQILTEELAATIAVLLDHSRDWLATLQQLRDIVYRQKRAYVMAKDDDDIDNSIRTKINDTRRGSEQLMTLVDKEVLGELTREDIHAFYIGDSSEDSADNKMLSELFDNYSEVEIRDRIQGGWHKLNAELDKITSIAAIKETYKRRRVLADYEADFERSHFESFVGAAQASYQLGSELPYSDTESMVRSAYLDRLYITELAQLAQALGRHDLDKIETEFDQYMRSRRGIAARLREKKEKQKIGELASVLQQIAAQKEKAD